MRWTTAVTIVVGMTGAVPAAGQTVLELGDLHTAAVEHDARAAQATLRAREHELRMENLSAERLPDLAVQGEAVHQSDVTTLGIALPEVEAPVPPSNRYQVALTANELVYDGGLLSRQADAEEARHAESLAELATILYPLRVEVNGAFFQALTLQSVCSGT